jgi:plastocyanin
MPFVARHLPRLLALPAAVVLLGAGLLLTAGGPAAAQAQNRAEVDGTVANKWEPATVNIRPGGTITFKVAGGGTHPVGSGTGPEQHDDKFDDSKCQLAQMTKVGDSCTVKFPKQGTYPFFCEVHFALGMTGTVNVGSGGGAATTTTTGGSNVVAPPRAAAPPSASRPAIYWAGWGLLALGALLALVLIALYVRYAPGFNRQKR